jgi:Fe2+ transport system protein FeoA
LLTTLSTWDRAQVVRIEAEEAAQLSGFGLYPGVILQIRQRFPSYIIKTDEIEIALEPEVACKIWVNKLEDPSSDAPGARRRRRRFRRNR